MQDMELVRTIQGPDHDAVEGPSGCAGGQLQGRRHEQQDSFGWVVDPGFRRIGEQRVLLVADGMGGHAGGAAASRAVIGAFAEGFRDTRGAISERLEDSLWRANRAVANAARDDPSLRGMGATLVAAHIAPGGFLRWLSVGDSPMWHLSNGKLMRLNRDHSMTPLLRQLVELGYMTPAEAAMDGRHHRLRSVVMGAEIPLIDLQDDAVELEPGDVLIVASDGIETLGKNDIAAVAAANATSPAALVTALLGAVRARRMPRQDNATVVVYVHRPAGMRANP